jgi:hypothetical protein
MREIIICGTFDNQDGKASGYMKKFFSNTRATVYNGGTWDKLIQVLYEEVPHYDIVYWFPNIPNNRPKLVENIKRLNPWCTLITAKNNRAGKYQHKDLVARMLNTRSALLVEFTEKDDRLLGTIHDPLGNVFIEKCVTPKTIYSVLLRRALKLRSFTRVGSIKVGSAIKVPNEEHFFNLVKKYAEKFHKLIHAANSSRFLGNTSFRCERGFPSFNSGDRIFVSQRNIDKRFVGQEGFVAVEHGQTKPGTGWKVHYYGDAKPSVDTPIQILLFENYKSAKYILHSHTYIEDAPYTNTIIPCGAIEEYQHIENMFHKDSCNFSINLKGHGSLVLATDLEYMENIPYIARPTPELILY